VASLACAFLMIRSYLRSRTRLLLWSGVAFVFLTVENVLLFCDMVVVPQFDLRAIRAFAGLLGVSLLLCSLIVENDKRRG
jgi:hypothetical protein